ncbi:MAG: alpha/beta hydrolase [Flavisolibacter sp.]
MQNEQAIPSNYRYYLKWIIWALVLQFALANISAAIYAYKFTHFFKNPPDWDVAHPRNVFDKTWKLFKGPSFGKEENEKQPTFPYQGLTLSLSNGGKIDAWYSQVPNPLGTICLFHGLTSSKAFYIDEANEFRNYGFNVFLLDFRGHGKSAGMQTTIGYNEAEEIKLAYDYLKAKGQTSIYLYGGSMGAVAVARGVAIYHLNPSGIILDMPFDGLLDHLKARGRSFGFPQSLFAVPVACWMSLESSIPVFSHKTSTYAKDIHCPVLLEWGTADHLVTQKETKDIFNALASKNKRLVVYDHGVHSSFLRQDPFKWKEAMHSFLFAH